MCIFADLDRKLSSIFNPEVESSLDSVLFQPAKLGIQFNVLLEGIKMRHWSVVELHFTLDLSDW